MTSRFRRLGRLFSCLLVFGVAAFAAEPNKTIVSESVFGSKAGSDIDGAVQCLNASAWAKAK